MNQTEKKTDNSAIDRRTQALFSLSAVPPRWDGDVDGEQAASVFDLLETRHLPALDVHHLEEGRAWTQPEPAIGGAVDDHGSQVGLEDGLVDIFINAALVVTITCHGNPAR